MSATNDAVSRNERALGAIASRESLADDFFGGWAPDDLELFQKHQFKLEGLPGYITDYFGIRTAVAFVPWASAHEGGVVLEPPIPNDGVRAEAIEYFSLIHSLEHSVGSQFSMVELGASYAPWACAAGVLARRQKKNKIVLRAVEASSYFHGLIMKNFADNELYPSNGAVNIDIQAIYGAVGLKRGTIFFPVVSSAFENGGQASTERIDVDYVGRTVAHEEVPVRTLDEILNGIDMIDLLHCDIQGSEGEVLIHGASQISQKVRHIFIGTHSRKIEGDLIECYHKQGWNLLRERPVTFQYKQQLSSVVGMTTRDGGQYWENTRFKEE